MLSLCMVCFVYIGGCFFSLFMFCKILIIRTVGGGNFILVFFLFINIQSVKFITIFAGTNKLKQ